MTTALERLIIKWESEMGSYIPNAPIYRAFIEEAKQHLEDEKELLTAVVKKSFYKGFECAETGDANCFTAWREEAFNILS